jgi:hypothetical protein
MKEEINCISIQKHVTEEEEEEEEESRNNQAIMRGNSIPCNTAVWIKKMKS